MTGRRSRDFKAEYARRIARGTARGVSRSQARGHPKPSELALRTKITFSRQLEEGLRAIRRGRTLTEAARSVHVAPERLRRYIGESGIAEKRGPRWVIGADTRLRQMLFYSDGEAIVVSVRPDQADTIGRYMSAVGRFLESNDLAFLDPFVGEAVTDAAGKTHPFETDPNALYRLAETGGSSFEDIYRIVV